MDNFKHKSTVSQCLALIPFEKLPALSIHQNNRGKKKLFTIPLLKVFVVAQLKGWRSYEEIEEGLRADKRLSEELGITSISASQLSRRIAQIPSELLQELFIHTVAQLQPLTTDLGGISDRIGRLKVVDSSKLKLPAALCDWARLSSDWTGVKVHTRLAVDNPDTTYPDMIIPSLGHVDDRRGANRLVVDSDATFVMDRGYVEYQSMDKWDEAGIRYVVRLWKSTAVSVLEEFAVEPNSNIIRDAKVKLGSKFRRMEREIRLVEFRDEQGRIYRVATNRWDLSPQEIAEIYKNRWLIELFFKWLKQHLPAAKIHCTSPQGIWNEIYLAMIAYLLSLHVRIISQSRKTQWQVLSMIRIYAQRPWSTFLRALRRKPSKSSSGRGKTGRARERPTDLSSGVALTSNNKP